MTDQSINTPKPRTEWEYFVLYDREAIVDEWPTLVQLIELLHDGLTAKGIDDKVIDSILWMGYTTGVRISTLLAIGTEYGVDIPPSLVREALKEGDRIIHPWDGVYIKSFFEKHAQASPI